MREIGSVPNSRDAQRLANYLLTLGIRSRVDLNDAGASLWVYEEDQREQATAELNQFKENPADPRYDEAARQARQLEREAAAKEKQYQKRVVDLRERWNGGRAGRRPVTVILVAISCAVAFGLGFGHEPQGVMKLSELWITPIVVDGDMVRVEGLQATLAGQWWRLVTPIFIHMTLMHLVFNMFATLDLGSLVEVRRGSWRMAGMVLLIAVVSNLAQYWWQEKPFFGGMSGVAYGLFGYIWMKSRFDPASGFFIHPTTVFMMVLWFVLCVGGAIGNVANAAHAAGLATGAVLALAPLFMRRA